MKEKLLDVLWFFEKVVRACFYMGAGIYLGSKAAIIIPQSNWVPHFLTGPAVLVCMIGCWSLATKVMSEPSRRELREAKKRADSDNKILYEMVREYEERMGK